MKGKQENEQNQKSSKSIKSTTESVPNNTSFSFARSFKN